jgi:hypothetical protein
MQDDHDGSRRRTALRWLASQLAWERRLATLRHLDDEPDLDERSAA